jgi:hypothetical protein
MPEKRLRKGLENKIKFIIQIPVYLVERKNLMFSKGLNTFCFVVLIIVLEQIKERL